MSGLDNKEWLRTHHAIQYASLSRARLYELNEAQEVRSFLLKPRKDAIRGIRLWSRSSIDQYFNRKYEEALAKGNPLAVVTPPLRKKVAGA